MILHGRHLLPTTCYVNVSACLTPPLMLLCPRSALLQRPAAQPQPRPVPQAAVPGPGRKPVHRHHWRGLAGHRHLPAGGRPFLSRRRLNVGWAGEVGGLCHLPPSQRYLGGATHDCCTTLGSPLPLLPAPAPAYLQPPLGNAQAYYNTFSATDNQLEGPLPPFLTDDDPEKVGPGGGVNCKIDLGFAQGLKQAESRVGLTEGFDRACNSRTGCRA